MRIPNGIVAALLLLLPLTVTGWGEKGHLMVNRLAIERAGPRLPSFMAAASDRIIYNGYEPDRWRQEAGTAMNTAQAPDHFLNSELWGAIPTIPDDRYAFMARLVDRKVELNRIGYLPYAMVETYERLRNAFRLTRSAANKADREAAQANAIYYAGLLGHYVADGSMPMHLTVHFNGWADGYPNPRGFTTNRMFHGRYETGFVNEAIDAAKVRARVRAPQEIQDVFGSIKGYLTESFGDLEAAYVLEKENQFKEGAPGAKAVDLVGGELARASNMLGDLWYTAWIESGKPVVQPGPRP